MSRGASAPVVDGALLGVSTIGNGAIVLRAQGGAMTVTEAVQAAGSGNIRLESGMASALLVNAMVSSGWGHISLMSGGSLNLSADVTTGGEGTIEIDSPTAGMTQSNGSRITALNGDVRLSALDDIVLASITTLGNVSLNSTGGSVMDADTVDVDGVTTGVQDGSPDVVANALRFDVGVGFGLLGFGVDNAIELDVAVLSGRAGAGGINVLEANDLRIDDVSATVNVVGHDGRITPLTDALQSDLATSSGGAIVARSEAGSVTVNDGTAMADGVGVRSGGGNILIEAGSVTGDLAINAALDAGGGHLTALAGNDLGLNANLLTQGTGTIDVEATQGTVEMIPGAVVQTDGSNVRVLAGMDVIVSLVDARAAANRQDGELSEQPNWGDVSVTAMSGSILDVSAAAQSLVDLFASNVRLLAGNGVGTSANAIETELEVVSAAAGGGGVNLLDEGSMSVGTVGPIPVGRVQPDGTTMTHTDSGDQTGVTKTGGDSTLRTGTNEPVDGYPGFQIVDFLDAGSRPNVQSGLYEQRVTISNANSSTIDAVRVSILDLPAGVVVVNAAGTLNGNPFIQYNLPLAPGQSVSLLIEYYSPDPAVIPITTSFLPEVTSVMPPLNPTGQIIDGVTVSRLIDNRLAISFTSLADRTYYVQFSDDGTNWTTSLAPLEGTGRRIVWVDNGPPKTPSDTVDGSVRTYRVVLGDSVDP